MIKLYNKYNLEIKTVIQMLLIGVIALILEYFKIVKRIQATHTAVENKYILDKYVFSQETIQDYSDNDELPF